MTKLKEMATELQKAYDLIEPLEIKLLGLTRSHLRSVMLIKKCLEMIPDIVEEICDDDERRNDKSNNVCGD